MSRLPWERGLRLHLALFLALSGLAVSEAGMTIFAGSEGYRFVASVDESIRQPYAAAYLLPLSSSNASGTVSCGQAFGSKTSKSVTPSTGSYYYHQNPLQISSPSQNISRNAFVVQSSVPISVMAIAGAVPAYGALLALQESSLGHTYFALTYRGQGYKSWMSVTAIKDDTQVELRFPHFVTLGATTSSNHSLTLNQYEAVIISADAELTGSYVTANKPIATLGGGTFLDSSGNSMGHVVEQMLPIEAWGKQFVVMATPPSTGQSANDIIRVVASQSSTTVHVIQGAEDVVHVLQQPGDWFEMSVSPPQLMVISSDKPVMAAKVMTSMTTYHSSTDKDVCMTLLIPNERWRSIYRMFRPPYGTMHYFVIITMSPYKNSVYQGTALLSLQILSNQAYAGTVVNYSANSITDFVFSCHDVSASVNCPLAVYWIEDSTQGAVCIPLGFEAAELEEESSATPTPTLETVSMETSDLVTHESSGIDTFLDSSQTLIAMPGSTEGMLAASSDNSLTPTSNGELTASYDGLPTYSSSGLLTASSNGLLTSSSNSVLASFYAILPSSTSGFSSKVSMMTSGRNFEPDLASLHQTIVSSSDSWRIVSGTSGGLQGSSGNTAEVLATATEVSSTLTSALNTETVTPTTDVQATNAQASETHVSGATSSASASLTDHSDVTSLSTSMTSVSSDLHSEIMPSTSTTLWKETPPPSRKSSLCPCKCTASGRHNQVGAGDAVREVVESLREELAVAKSNTSRAIRGKVSVRDPRTSSRAMGGAAILLLCILAAVIFLPDVPRIICDIRRGFKGRTQRSKDSPKKD